MKKPRKAMILAAGYGTRMGPITDVIPKPMLPLNGKPVIGHTIDTMISWGVKDILINLHHLPGPIVDYVQSLNTSARISFSFEPEILGTGGALRRADWFLNDGPTWVVNSDIAFDVSPHSFIREYEKSNPLAVLWMNGKLGPLTVEVSGARIRTFRSKRPGTKGTYTFCGLHLVSPSLLDYLEPGFSSVITAYERAMADGFKVRAAVPDKCSWHDLGNPSQYIAAQSRSRSIGRNVSIAPGTVIKNSVVMDGAVIQSGAILNGAVVAPGTKVRGGGYGPVMNCGLITSNPSLHAALDAIGWQSQNSVAAGMGSRASSRRFTRLTCGRQSAMLVEYDPERKENTRYVGHTHFLAKQGIPVPAVLANLPEINTSVFEDLGDASLGSELTAKNRMKLYRSTLDALLKMHSVPSAALKPLSLEPGFTPRLYRWEHEYMAQHFLKKRAAKSKDTEAIMLELELMSQVLLKEKRVLLHRDMQSSNIQLRRGKPYFIDFQGMRMGPSAYDVASLLCDPYVMLPRKQQMELLAYYRSIGGDVSDAVFWIAGIQRLVQAIGAFARLGSQPGTARFAAHIGPALNMLRRCLRQTGGMENLRRIIERL